MILLIQGKITMEEFSKLPLKYFARNVFRSDNDCFEFDNATVAENEIQLVEDLVEFLAKDINLIVDVDWKLKHTDGQNIRLGSFLRNFISIREFKSFEPTSLAYDILDFDNGCDDQWDDWGDGAPQYTDENESTKFCCGGLNEHETFLHDFFSILTPLFGFDQVENISLFDIPSMLANIDTTSQLTKHYPFLFTRCQNQDEIQLFSFDICVHEWDKYIDSKGILI